MLNHILNKEPSIYPENKQLFGSGCHRFKDDMYINQSTQDIGPGYYSQPKSFVDDKQKQYFKQYGFNQSDKRFENDIKYVDVGPGKYEVSVQDIANQLQKKVKKTYVGQFGKQEQRFRSDKQKEAIPGPGSYIKVQLPEDPQDYQQTANFTSEEIRFKYNLHQDIPAVGTYELSNQNFSTKPDFKAVQVPFNTNQKRFQQKQIDSIDEDEDEENQNFDQNDLKKHYLKLSNNKQQQVAPFKTLEERFKNSNNKIPGPGEYQLQKQWQKSSFNINFIGDIS